MAGQLLNYTYTGNDGVSYSGQVVADTTNPKYNYIPGQTYLAQNGTYKIDTTPGVATNAPVGSVYQTTYTDATGKAYDTYHYDPRTNAYYNVKTQPYDPATGTYTPPATPDAPSSTPVPMWSTKNGLGEEYAYIKTPPTTPGAPDNNYHVYGGGGEANATITPAGLGLTAYNYKFQYSDDINTYYLGRVIDDGTFGYSVGQVIPKAGGTYQIYAVDPAKPAPSELAGYTYTTLYHDASGTNYPPSDIIPATPYYQKPVGYGGVGTENDYVAKPGGYYQFNSETVATASPPLTSVPLPT